MSQTAVVELVTVPEPPTLVHIDETNIEEPALSASHSHHVISKGRAASLIATLTMNVAMNTCASGIITLSVPQIAKDVGLVSDLWNW